MNPGTRSDSTYKKAPAYAHTHESTYSCTKYSSVCVQAPEMQGKLSHN